jgi:DNA-binding winged helix-turn-helix (wHTH) protein/Tol biopolymer transport system component
MKTPKNPESRDSPPAGAESSPATSVQWRFGEFSLDPGARKLRRHGEPVQLPSRAFDTLTYLVGKWPRIVEKDELLGAAWHDVAVTDDSLIHAVSVIRRALGDDAAHASFIETIPRRGYRFVAAVEAIEKLPPPSMPREYISAERWRTHGLAAAAVALLAVAATAAYRAVVGESPQATSRIEQAAPPGTTILSGGVLSPAGRHLAFVAQDESGETSLWVRALDSETPRRLPGTEGASKPFFSPDGRSLAFFARGQLQSTDLEGQALRTISASEVTGTGGSWGSRGLILFADWPSGIYSVPSSGGPVTQLTRLNHAALEVAHAWPHFLPDGRHFLYQVISRDRTQAGVYVGSVDAPGSMRLLENASVAAYAPPGFLLYLQQDLLMAQPFDAERLRLTGRPVLLARGLSAPTLSDGHVISGSRETLAFRESGASQHLTRVDRSGAQLQVLDVPASMVNFRLSPDNHFLVSASSLTDATGLWVVDLARGRWTRLAADGIAPLWSPDGRRLAYTSRGGHELYVRAAADDTMPTGPLVRDQTVKVLNEWSRDGRHIIYAQHSSATKLDLWILPLDAGPAKLLLNTPFNEAQARLSPDGRWIAYVSDESGAPEVYIRRYPGMDEPRRVSVGGGGQPQWRADQQELFYLAQDGWLMAVALAGRHDVSYGTPRRLFRTSIGSGPSAARDSYAVLSDGRSFVIDGRHDRDRDSPITMMRNWAAGLQRPDSDLAGALGASIVASAR